MRNRLSMCLVIASCVAAGLFWTKAEARPEPGQCDGILHKDGPRLWFGGARGEGESICVIASSEVSKVLKTCSPRHYCRVVGSVDTCKDSGECAEITSITSVSSHKKHRRR